MRREYGVDFYDNAEIALESELIVQELLGKIYEDKQFYSEHYNEGAYHLGDIISDDGVYYEVKDDGVIHRTNNVFTETKKKWKNSHKITDGWMYTEKPSYLCVLDMVAQRLFILDFEKLKEIYNRKNRFITTDLGDNYSSGYLVPLWKCKENDAIVYATGYSYDESWNMYELAPLDKDTETILQ